jgi:hypothetical protein
MVMSAIRQNTFWHKEQYKTRPTTQPPTRASQAAGCHHPVQNRAVTTDQQPWVLKLPSAGFLGEHNALNNAAGEAKPRCQLLRAEVLDDPESGGR